MKVSELEGPELDYWVGMANGFKCKFSRFHPDYGERDDYETPKTWAMLPRDGYGPLIWYEYNPLTDWSQGGPISEREGISVEVHCSENGKPTSWKAGWKWPMSGICVNRRWQCGSTPLIAAMRCFVASKYGEEVPDK